MSASESVQDETPQEFLPASLRRPGGNGPAGSIIEIPGHIRDTTNQRGGGNRRKPEPAPRRSNQNTNSSKQPGAGGNGGNNNPNGNSNDSDSESGNDDSLSLASQFDGWDRSLNPLHQARSGIVLTPKSPWIAALNQQAAHNTNPQTRATVVRLLFSSPDALYPSNSTNAAIKGINQEYKAACKEVAAMDAARDKYIAIVVFDEVDKDFGGSSPGADPSSWDASADMDTLLREVEMALIKRCRAFDRGSSGPNMETPCAWTAAELDSPERVDIRLLAILHRMIAHLATSAFYSQISRAKGWMPWLEGRSLSRVVKETYRHVICPADEETGPGRKKLADAYFKAFVRAVVAATKPTEQSSIKFIAEMGSKIRGSRSAQGNLSDEYKEWLRSFTTDEAIVAAQVEFLQRRAKSRRLREDRRVVSQSPELRYHFLNGVDRPGAVTLALVQTNESGSLRLPVAIKEVLPEDLAAMGWVCDVRPDGSVSYWRRGVGRASKDGISREGIFKFGMHGEVIELLSASSM
ncbi:hypothetical protein QBC34DRAFT_412235 [Podospora aff. communis PSN243]|uniref:Uncharacterized protein n=1 Tax=Podospora aff. communis PSN243 TaxID=3040156 RepID=A0AAV9GC58_9PEZI|nr:hypothetical protein QBC34DRAFT_412235 [Podospora aff. communis PSN243]